jgi:hypothetical protein
VVHLDVQQNLDVAHLVVAHLDELHPLVAVVDVERLRQLRMDYYLDEVGVELLPLPRMGCCQDVVQQVRPVKMCLELVVLVQLVQQEFQLLVQQRLPLRLPALLREMP